MRKKTRTILFFSLFLAFVLFTPAVILYSQGYRFDFEKGKITQTGAIFLQVEPKQAEVFLNNKFAKRTDFFFGSSLLENLLPGNYKITLKKEGYHLWEKNLEVKEKHVAEVKKIILTKDKINFATTTEKAENLWPTEKETPKNILIVFGNHTFSKEDGTFYVFNNASEEFEKILEGLKGYRISPDSGKLVFFSDSEIWIFYLKDKVETPAKKAGQRQFLVRLSEKIGDVFWLNNDYLIFNTGNKIKISETDERDRVNAAEIANFENPEIFFNPTDKKIYVLSQNELSASEKLNY